MSGGGDASPELTGEVGFGAGASPGGCWLCWQSALHPPLASALVEWERSTRPELLSGLSAWGELGVSFQCPPSPALHAQ